MSLDLVAAYWEDFVAAFWEDIRIKTEKAEERAMALLKEWLTPRQRDQLKDENRFVAIGSSTGREYTIYADRPIYNVVDEKNDVERCFIPYSGKAFDPMPLGDILLAQKLAIECDEDAAIAIANIKRKPTDQDWSCL